MTEEIDVPDSEEQIDQAVETIEETRPSKMVPLEALEAERRKRQDLEAHNRAMQDMMLQKRSPEPIENDEDDEEFITKAEMKRRIKDATFGNKREVLEESFCTSNPQAVEMITAHLENIIKRKPWLAQTIDSAPNRYARAYEIVQDYMPKEKEVTPASRFSTPQADAKKIVENAQKPGSPATIAKGSNNSNADYLRSIAGKPEFREYRRKVLGK